MRGQLGNLMQQAQKMQENVKKIQEELAHVEVEGQAGAGMVKVTMTAKLEARRVSFDHEMVKDDPEMLEDLLVAAFNDAANKANEAASARMKEATAGLPLPPGMNLFG